MASYSVATVVRATWQFFVDPLKSWGKAFVEACAALGALLVSDNILAFTRSLYYQPLAYGGFLVVVTISFLGRKKEWYGRFRRLSLQTSAWILSTIAIVILGFAEKDVYFFDAAQPLGYNLLVVIALLFLILLPTPIFMLSDLTRDTDTRLRGLRQKRVPTIFNPEFIVDEKKSLFDRIVAVLQD